MDFKKIVLLVSLFGLSMTLSAQEFYGGILGGFNGSKVKNDRSVGYHKLGLVAGAWVQHDFTDNWYWGMELKVNQKGSRILPTVKNGNWKYVFRLNYIDLPVLVGYKVKPYWSAFAGLSYGYLFYKSGYDNFGPSPIDSYGNLTNWEVGLFAGLRVDFDKLVEKGWARNFILETRFQNSLFSIDKSHDFFTYYLAIGQYNNVISTVLYYRIEWPGND